VLELWKWRSPKIALSEIALFPPDGPIVQRFLSAQSRDTKFERVAPPTFFFLFQLDDALPQGGSFLRGLSTRVEITKQKEGVRCCRRGTPFPFTQAGYGSVGQAFPWPSQYSEMVWSFSPSFYFPPSAQRPG